MLSVLTVILRYIRCTALNWVELVLDCDVIWCGQMKTKVCLQFHNTRSISCNAQIPHLFYLSNPFISLITDADEGKKIKRHFKDKSKKEGWLSLEPRAKKGLQVNIRKVILCCVYGVYVSACQTIFNFPQFKDQKIRFETNLQSFHLFFQNRSEALCEPNESNLKSFIQAEIYRLIGNFQKTSEMLAF